MRIGLIIALVLAIPTFGLSFVVWLLWIYIGVKARSTKATYHAAERQTRAIIANGGREYPSWINDPMWQKTFATSTLEEAIKSGMSQEQAKIWFSQQDVADGIMTMAAQLEKANFSKLDQISGAMEFTGKLAAAQARHWNSLDPK